MKLQEIKAKHNELIIQMREEVKAILNWRNLCEEEEYFSGDEAESPFENGCVRLRFTNLFYTRFLFDSLTTSIKELAELMPHESQQISEYLNEIGRR